jgi:molybdate-binding protein
VRLARIHLVVREIGLVAARGGAVLALGSIDFHRFAARPRSAGVRGHLERALRAAGIDLDALGRARTYASHRDVVHAVARGDADAGIATRAWADRLGLAFRALTAEAYGLVVRARDLGDPRVVAVCEVAQSPGYRADLGRVAGYDATDSGAVQYHFGSPVTATAEAGTPLP